MFYIESPKHDPQWNLALEEHLFFSKHEEIFMLWQNSDAIIIGKNQNAMAEIDYGYVTEHNIPVVRRLSGGGAVFHDMGNVNFTYIVNREGYGDYVGFTKVLRDFLASKGLKAEVSGRNDVLVDGMKFSGNAQYFHNGRLLHHGTILIDTDMSRLTGALRPDEAKIASKGIKSVKSRVMNLGDRLSVTPAKFLQLFRSYVFENENVSAYALTKEDADAVETLYKEKYTTFAWNFGYSPVYAFHTKKRFPGGGVEVYLDIRDGIIQDARIFGDFLEDAAPLMEKLCGAEHSKETLEKILVTCSLGAISKEELLSCFI